MKKHFQGNWHVLFIDRAMVFMYIAISVLAFGYWRDVAFRYSWGFIISLGWWGRFIVSMSVAILPLILCDSLWHKLREIMIPYCRYYRDYAEPLFPDEAYREFYMEQFAEFRDGEIDELAALTKDTESGTVSDEVLDVDYRGLDPVDHPPDIISGKRFALNLALLALIIWVIVFAPLDDYNALVCYMVFVMIGLSLALFASIMALFEYARSDSR